MVVLRRFGAVAACGVMLSMAPWPAPAGEVNIYSYRKEHLILPQLKAFAKATGISYNIVTGGADALAQRIRREGANSPADVLLTVDAAAVVRDSQAQRAVRGMEIDIHVRGARMLPHILQAFLEYAERGQRHLGRKLDFDLGRIELDVDPFPLRERRALRSNRPHQTELVKAGRVKAPGDLLNVGRQALCHEREIVGLLAVGGRERPHPTFEHLGLDREGGQTLRQVIV